MKTIHICLLEWAFAACVDAEARKPVALYGSASGRLDVELIINTCCLPEDVAYDVPYSDAGEWLEPSEFSKYSGVIICRQRGDKVRQWADEEIASVTDYVRSGGHLIFLTGSPMAFAGSSRNVSRLEKLLGAAYIGDAGADSVLLAGKKLTTGLKEKTYSWLGKGLALEKLSGAEVIVGTPAGKRTGGQVALRRIGNGRVTFFGLEWFRMFRNDEAGAKAYGQMIRVAIEAIGATVPSTRERWAAEPLGPENVHLRPAPPPVRQKLQSRLKQFNVPREMAETITLVEDGRPHFTVVTAGAQSETVRSAVREFARAFKRWTGHAPMVKPEAEIAAGHSSPIVVLGDTTMGRKLGIHADGLPPEGYRIQSIGTFVFIVGQDKTPEGRVVHGTLHGAFALLHRLGFRWLWPGELGEIFPVGDKLDLPPLYFTDAPALRQRKLRNSGSVYGADCYHDPPNATTDAQELEKQPPTEFHSQARYTIGLSHLNFEGRDFVAQRLKGRGWFARQRLGRSIDLLYTHAYSGWWDRFGKEHPDWFALQPNGLRTQEPKRERLCLTNKGLIDQIARDKIAELEANQKQDAVSISPNDGSAANNFCMCTNCRRQDPVNAPPVKLMFTRGRVRSYVTYPSLTDRYVGFYSAISERVAKKHPNRWLGAYAYSSYRTPPLYAKLHPNILLGFVGLGYFDDASRARDLANWNQWSNTAHQILLRPNALHGGSGIPAVFIKRLSSDIRHCYETGMIATDFDSIMHHWSTQGLNYYVLARLLWDPNQDTDAIVKDYCRSGFGPAADSVQKYFSKLEEMTDAIAATTGKQTEGELRAEEAGPAARKSNFSDRVGSVFTPQRIELLKGLLKQARTAAAGKEQIQKRIDFLNAGLRYGDLQAQLYRLASEMNKADSEKKSQIESEAHSVLSKRYRLFKEIFTRQHFALNVAHLSYRESKLWERTFNWKPPKNRE